MVIEGDQVEDENNGHRAKDSPKHIVDREESDGNEFITRRKMVQFKEKQKISRTKNAEVAMDQYSWDHWVLPR